MSEIEDVPELVGRLRGAATIGIDGAPNAGKSFVAGQLIKRLNASCVSVDTFVHRRTDRYVDAVRRDDLLAAVLASPTPVIIEGMCLLDVLSRIALVPDAFVYVKRYSLAGVWLDEEECEPPDDLGPFLNSLSELAAKVSRALGDDEPCGLSSGREEMIRYHHKWRPIQGAIVFRNSWSDDLQENEEFA